MAVKKRGLGRGLDALLNPASVGKLGATGLDGTLRKLPVESLARSRFQPRTEIDTDSLQELADSIRVQGLVQPIVVRAVVGGRYEIIAGERRWRAAQLAGLTEIPAVVREVDDRAAIAMALIENIQRENLNPLEEANALERLIREFELTHQQAAEAVGRSRAAVSNLLRLLELHDSVKEMVQKGQLEMGHARALLALPLKAQPDAAHQVAHRDLTVRATERLVKQLLTHPAGAATPATRAQSPDLLRLEQDLGDRLGARVQVKHGKGGKGQLVIQYNSLDELDGILGRIR
jgi:ParB family transcriptional regulator, chromosome partitioning protein